MTYGGCSRMLESPMSDDRSCSGGQDRKRIDTSEDHEIRDGSRKLGVTPDEPKAALKAVGNDASAV